LQNVWCLAAIRPAEGESHAASSLVVLHMRNVDSGVVSDCLHDGFIGVSLSRVRETEEMTDEKLKIERERWEIECERSYRRGCHQTASIILRNIIGMNIDEALAFVDVLASRLREDRSSMKQRRMLLDEAVDVVKTFLEI